MICEWKDRFVDRPLIYRSPLQPWQDPHAAPASLRFYKQNPARLNNESMIFAQSFHRRPRLFYRKGFRIFCAAEFVDRADIAFWLAWQTNQRTQIDERGVETRGTALWNQLRSAFPKFFATDCRINRGAKVEQASKEARNIRFENRDRSIKSERRNCVRSVAANTGQLATHGDVTWKNSPVSFLHNFCGGVKISRASVVAEALPRVKNVVF